MDIITKQGVIDIDIDFDFDEICSNMYTKIEETIEKAVDKNSDELIPRKEDIFVLLNTWRLLEKNSADIEPIIFIGVRRPDFEEEPIINAEFNLFDIIKEAVERKEDYLLTIANELRKMADYIEKNVEWD